MADQKIKAQPKPQPALKKEEAKILPEILPKTREEILEEVEEGKLFIATEGKPTFIPKGYEAIELRLDEDVEPYPFLLEEKVLLYDSKRDIISSMDNVCRCFMEISRYENKLRRENREVPFQLNRFSIALSNRIYPTLVLNSLTKDGKSFRQNSQFVNSLKDPYILQRVKEIALTQLGEPFIDNIKRAENDKELKALTGKIEFDEEYEVVTPITTQELKTFTRVIKEPKEIRVRCDFSSHIEYRKKTVWKDRVIEEQKWVRVVKNQKEKKTRKVELPVEARRYNEKITKLEKEITDYMDEKNLPFDKHFVPQLRHYVNTTYLKNHPHKLYTGIENGRGNKN